MTFHDILDAESALNERERQLTAAERALVTQQDVARAMGRLSTPAEGAALAGVNMAAARLAAAAARLASLVARAS